MKPSVPPQCPGMLPVKGLMIFPFPGFLCGGVTVRPLWIYRTVASTVAFVLFFVPFAASGSWVV